MNSTCAWIQRLILMSWVSRQEGKACLIVDASSQTALNFAHKTRKKKDEIAPQIYTKAPESSFECLEPFCLNNQSFN